MRGQQARDSLLQGRDRPALCGGELRLVYVRDSVPILIKDSDVQPVVVVDADDDQILRRGRYPSAISPGHQSEANLYWTRPVPDDDQVLASGRLQLRLQ